MEYLKIWTSFREVISPLNDAEKGRLFDAMLNYAADEEEPDLKGNERFIWPAAKQAIDRAAQKAEILRENGSRGGRPRKETKENQIKANETKENQTKADESYPFDKEKDKEKVKIKKTVSYDTAKEMAFEVFWTAYPRHTNKKAALQAFLRLNPDDALMQTILEAIARQRNSQQWTKDGGQFIPHPATWLNGRRWEDEMPKGGKTVSAQQYTQRSYTEADLSAFDNELIEEARRKKNSA